MAEDSGTIRINRAPVLTLWAAVVAERLGFDLDAALTLGRALAGPSAHAKGVSLGIIEPSPELVRGRGQELGEGEQLYVGLLGRAVPVEQTPGGVRAIAKGKPCKPAQVEKYLIGRFGADLEVARAAMEALASCLEPVELQRSGFRLYERFRPDVPKGESGWGAAGELDLAKVRAAAA